MDVMKGKDMSVPGGSTGVVPGDQGWVADGLKPVPKQKESKKGKERADSVESEAVDEIPEDDDVAWMKKRQTAQLQEEAGQAETVNAVSCLESVCRALLILSPTRTRR